MVIVSEVLFDSEVFLDAEMSCDLLLKSLELGDRCGVTTEPIR